MIISVENDKKYYVIISDILENDEFIKMKDIVHHGMNRYNHSVRVSYYSYKFAKALRLDYKSAARGGLLHDFFLVRNEDITLKSRIKTMIKHPKYALEKSKEHFNVNLMEEDIILSHMFPISIRAPRYLESWVVDIVDNLVSQYEWAYQMKTHLSTALNILFFLVLNYLR